MQQKCGLLVIICLNAQTFTKGLLFARKGIFSRTNSSKGLYFLTQIPLKSKMSIFLYTRTNMGTYLSPKCPPPLGNTRCTCWRQHKLILDPHLFDKTENFKYGFQQILHLNEGPGTPLFLLKNISFLTNIHDKIAFE